ncbi:hypothetical protein BDZ91DRAFT_373041 [Kalaharituber pfeilii]|nr:hypothetical protein BDZ91DRAFT_373041 [Kalaharituber pfeilii]
MEALNTFNFNILKSPLFKLTLGDKKQSAENDDNTAFFVQRELLASVSPEMRKHIENGMKEGLNGEMVLYDVDEDTLQRFLQWAYMKDYETSQSTNPALLLHAKLYVFADRFNIGSLKDLSFGKLISILNEDPVPDPSAAADVFTAAKYAIENLPALTESLVDYLLRYIAQMLDNVCGLPEFEELAVAHPHAAVAIVRLAREERPSLIPNRRWRKYETTYNCDLPESPPAEAYLLPRKLKVKRRL